MARGILMTAEQFAEIVAAAGVLRDLAAAYPTEYGEASQTFDNGVLRQSREHYLDNRWDE